MSDFVRTKEGFRFQFGGMKLNAAPDTLAPNKYAMAVNVRSYSDQSVRTRPGLILKTNLLEGNPVLNLRAYAALATDNTPRILSYMFGGHVRLDTGTIVGSLSDPNLVPGAAMIPFRPAASPNPYMYIANGSDYQKFSAPSATNIVTKQKVGIAEPQTPPDASLANFIGPNESAPSYGNTGTAGAPGAVTRVTDTVGAAVFSSSLAEVVCQVSANVAYQKLMYVTVNGIPNLVLDVFPPIPTALALAGIFYFAGATGRCILSINVLTEKGQGAENSSIYDPILTVALRRGAILKIGSEACQILSVTTGLDGTLAVEIFTSAVHTIADTILTLPAIRLANINGVAVGNAILASGFSSSVTNGIGLLTTASGLVSPFLVGFTGTVVQVDDYITMGFRVSSLVGLNELKILFDISDGTFTKDFYYYTVRANDLAAAIANASTQIAGAQTFIQRALIDEERAVASGNQGVTSTSAQISSGDNVWAQIVFSISELTRVGSDATKSLLNFSKFQVLCNVNATVTVSWDGFFGVFGGFQPDVGDVGAPLQYRVRPRSKVTGAMGNPSPATRYGVNPRRQAVLVALPDPTYDPQIDTWDIFRYGGSVTSWRYVGSTPSSNSTFLDNYSDDAVGAGAELDFDNFEPWPVVDIPNNGVASIVSGTVAIISTPDPDTPQYLPGTLVQLGGQNVYTLRTRPTLLSGTTYLLDLVENAGVGTNVLYNIQEPLIANAKLPFMWGPDVNGTVFAVGDSFNPGKLYFAKNYAPDSAPDTYNIEITQPSEPLLGGEVLDGLSFVASSKHWWALYPTPDNPAQRYNFVQQPMTRGLASPYGHCNDGVSIYWWAKDGIWSSTKGSLTDEDLYNLFPHEGVQGNDVDYNGSTVPAPDYSQAHKFRLSYANGYLYAIYISNNVYRMLVLNLRTMAWSMDEYSVSVGPVSFVYEIEQQVESNSTLNPVILMAGFADLGFGAPQALLFTQTDLHNDNASPIDVTIASHEFDGGDLRAPKQWGDYFLDLLPAAAAGVTATPMSLGAPVAPPSTVPNGNSRVRLPLSVGGVVVTDFLGLLLQWTDDFTQQSIPTKLFVWQPSLVVQPASAISWATFGTSMGLKGFGHIRQIAMAWVSQADITLTFQTFDGQDAAPVIIPNSGGVFKKQLFPLSANKGQLFNFTLSSPAPFQIFEDDIEIYLGEWGRQDAYRIVKGFGGMASAKSPV